MIGRRALLAGLSLFAGAAGAAAVVRLGLLQFGTVQWVAETMRRHRFDAARGVVVKPVLLANNDAGRIAMMAGSADIVVSDWPFAAAQRAAGNALCFAPFSSALGGVMVPAASPIRGLADLPGKRLGVAGGKFDKSWLIVQAAAKADGTDLAAADVVYGAPPLLGAKLQQGELDAVLTFWTFAARLEAAGFREAVAVADAAQALGLPAAMPLVGYIFREDWARANRAAIDGFLAAADDTERLLGQDDAAWTALRPLIDAPDDALFMALRRRFRAGIFHPSVPQQRAAAARVVEVLLRVGGPRALPGVTALPDGLFWERANGGT